MKWLTRVMVLLVVTTAGLSPVPRPAEPEGGEPAAGFAAVPVYVDPGGRPLAAYQFALSATNANLRVVGLENGEHPAFATPPYHDPAAIAEGDAGARIVVADFSLRAADALPTARVRVTTVMVQVTRLPGVAADARVDYRLELMAAGDPAGDRIDAVLDRADLPKD